METASPSSSSSPSHIYEGFSALERTQNIYVKNRSSSYKRHFTGICYLYLNHVSLWSTSYSNLYVSRQWPEMTGLIILPNKRKAVDKQSHIGKSKPQMNAPTHRNPGITFMTVPPRKPVMGHSLTQMTPLSQCTAHTQKHHISWQFTCTTKPPNTVWPSLTLFQRLLLQQQDIQSRTLE